MTGRRARRRSKRSARISPKRAGWSLTAAGALCRGQPLLSRRLELFAGAAACVMTSVAVAGLEARCWPLAELFAP